jgi:hypothetical protein
VLATIYLRSTTGANGNTGLTSWANAKATLAAAMTAAGAGGTVYVSQVHAESSAGNMALSSPGTAASPIRIICVNDASAPPTAVATTATVSATGTPNINFDGYAYCYGVTFKSGSGTGVCNITFNPITGWWWRLEDCRLWLVGNNSNAEITVGNSGASTNDQLLELINCTLSFANVSQAVNASCNMIWKGGGLAGSVPTSLFARSVDGPPGDVSVYGVDLSAIDTGNNLVAYASAGNAHKYHFENCALGSGYGVVTGTHPGQGGPIVRITNCGNASASNNYAYYRYQGTITSETTIVKTGGSTDGAASISMKMVSNANAKWISPLESDPIYTFFAAGAGSKGVSVSIVTDGVTLTDTECWIEVEYLDDIASNQSTITNDRSADVLATAANQTTDTATWTTTGLASPVKQKLTKTVILDNDGPLIVRVMLAKASTTVYVDMEPI